MASTDKVNCAAKVIDTNTEGKTGKRNNANKKPSSKERRKRYVAALERAVQSLRTTSTSLSSQLNLLEEDTKGLSSRNKDLKLRMQSMENELHLQDARNEVLKKEIQELREMIRQSIQNRTPTRSFPWSFGSDQEFQTQNLQVNQFQQHIKEIVDFDMDDSSNSSPSKDTMTTIALTTIVFFRRKKLDAYS